MGTALEDRPRYTPTSTFETFPFPWPPGKEPVEDARVQAIATAAKELVEKRDAWLNPPGATQQELVTRTLTKLYNARPAWLTDAPPQTRRSGRGSLWLARHPHRPRDFGTLAEP